MTSILIEGDTDTHRKCLVKMKAEIRVMLPQAKELQK